MYVRGVSRNMYHDRTTPTVETTETSLEIIELVQELDGARLADVTSELGLAKSTAYKHLLTLEENGYLIKKGEMYHIGLKFLNLGEYARSRWSGFKYIKEAVSELTERTEEEVDFVAEDNGRVTTICESYHKWVKYGDQTDSSYRADIGTYYHMHATASGLAILATYPTERVEAVIAEWGLPARTDQTITSREELFAELERINERGYAVDDEYYTAGLRSVGKTVRGPGGDVLGALSVSGPMYRVDGSVLEEEIPRELSNVVESVESKLVEAAHQ